MTGPEFVTAGGMIIDWVITANGDVNKRGCGGNSLYSAAAARLWSDKVAPVGCCGIDWPREFTQAFLDAGMNMSAIHQFDEPHAMIAGFVYDQEGNRTTFRSQEILSRWGEKDAPAMRQLQKSWPQVRPDELSLKYGPKPDQMPASFWEAKGFHLAPWMHQIQGPFVEELHRRSIPFTVDPGKDWSREVMGSMLQKIPVFLPSEEDVTFLLGEVEPEQAAKKFADLGAQVVAIKLGQRGSLVFDARQGKFYHVPVYPAKTKDPTGCGDSYCGGFLTGWVETGNALEAALRGTVSASFVVQDFDARYALRFSRADAEARLSELRKLLS